MPEQDLDALTRKYGGVTTSAGTSGATSGPRRGDAIRNLPSVPFTPVPEFIQRFLRGAVADVVDDPAKALPDVGGQGGAMAGAAIGSMVAPGPGTVLGGLVGAGVGGAAGKVGENVIKARPATEGATGAGVTQAALQAVPLAGKPLRAGGHWLYRRVLAPAASDIAKMSESAKMLPQQVVDKLAQTALDYRIPITRGGVAKADRFVSALDDEVTRRIDLASQRGVTVNPQQIMAEAQAWLTKKFGPAAQNIPQDDMAQIAAKLDQFAQNPTITKPRFGHVQQPSVSPGILPPPPPTVAQTGQSVSRATPVGDVNQMRRGSNKNVRDKYGRGIKDAGTETEKALVHAESAAIQNAVPDIKPAMAAIHDLINLNKSVVRRQTGASNAQLFRLYEFLGLLGGNVPAVGLGVLSRPGVTSHVAIGADQLGRAFERADPALVRMALIAAMQEK